MIKIGRWEGNEIIYTTDVVGNSVNLIEDFDFAFDVIGSDAVMSGMVVTEAAVPDMTILISAGIAHDFTVKNYLDGEALVGTVIASDPVNDRRDIVEVQRLIEDVDPATRQFRDSITEAISDQTIDTKTEYKTQIRVTIGTPAASPIAPSVSAGWMKIAEILVPAASTTVIDANIFNVDAIKAGNENSDWTADITSIYRNGSISGMKTRIADNTTEGIPLWINSKSQRYYATESVVNQNGNIYQARLGNDTTFINSEKDPETNPMWWILIWETPVVPAYDDTENVLYETKGYIVERFGTHYSSSGKTSNLGKDPEDPQNEDYWIASPGWDILKAQSNQADPIPGGMHPSTDFSSGDYQQNIKIDIIKRGATIYDIYRICLDATQVTGDTTLEDDILAVGTAKEYLRLDEYFPEDVGIKDCIDMRGRSTRAITAGGGVAATLAEVQEDQFQGWQAGMATSDDSVGGPYYGESSIEGQINDAATAVNHVRSVYNDTNQGSVNMITAQNDGTNGTPRTGLDTHGMLLVRGVDYIIVIIAQ